MRAQRRTDELTGTGAAADLDATLREMRARDQRDSQRAVAPLLQAADAIAIDSSGQSIDEVVARILAIVRDRERRPAP